jgi:hypothetical protein
MPNFEEFNASLRDIPEFQVLATCAARYRTRFWLKSTAIADLLLRFNSWYKNPVSFYDFVGPFEEITLLFENQEDKVRLEHTVADSLPLAGFYRWSSYVGRDFFWYGRLFKVHIDFLIIEFDGTQAGEPKIALSAIRDDPATIVKSFTNHESFDPALQWDDAELYPYLLASVLRTAQLWFAYAPADSPVNEDLVASMAERVSRASKRVEPGIFLSPFFAGAIEDMAMELLFSARDIRAAVAWLRESGIALLPLLYPSPILRVLLEPELMQAKFITGVLRESPRRRYLFPVYGLAPQLARPSSIVPWTSIGVENTGWENDCCRYRDFRIPPAVIVWKTLEELGFAHANPGNLGVAMRWQDQGTQERLVHPVPGVLFRRAALIARIDHGYASTVAGNVGELEYGIVAETLEEHQ